MNFTVKEAAAVFGQQIENETPLASVEFDSRLIKENSLFVPLAGTRDGHEFAQQAKDNGAIATLWSHPTIPSSEKDDSIVKEKPSEGLLLTVFLIS